MKGILNSIATVILGIAVLIGFWIDYQQEKTADVLYEHIKLQQRHIDLLHEKLDYRSKVTGKLRRIEPFIQQQLNTLTKDLKLEQEIRQAHDGIILEEAKKSYGGK